MGFNVIRRGFTDNNKQTKHKGRQTDNKQPVDSGALMHCLPQTRRDQAEMKFSAQNALSVFNAMQSQ